MFFSLLVILLFGPLYAETPEDKFERHKQFVRDHLPEFLTHGQEFVGGNREAMVAQVAEWIGKLDTLIERGNIARGGEGRPFHEKGVTIVGTYNPGTFPWFMSDIISKNTHRILVFMRLSGGVSSSIPDIVFDVRGATLCFVFC